MIFGKANPGVENIYLIKLYKKYCYKYINIYKDIIFQRGLRFSASVIFGKASPGVDALTEIYRQREAAVMHIGCAENLYLIDI